MGEVDEKACAVVWLGEVVLVRLQWPLGCFGQGVQHGRSHHMGVGRWSRWAVGAAPVVE